MTTNSSSLNSTQIRNPTLGKLINIFDKVKRGVGLTALERGFLTTCSQLAPSLTGRLTSLFFTPSDEGSVQTTDSLAGRILRREVPVLNVFSEVEQRLHSSSQPTARETASFAKLISSCLARDDIFTNTLGNFRSQEGRDPTRGELIQLVASHNTAVPANLGLAGQVIAKVNYFNERLTQASVLDIRYSREGTVEIIEGPLAPIDVRYGQVLTQAQLNDMLSVYTSLSKDTPYNNLGETLEFIQYFNEQKRINQHITLKQAFDSYRPDLVQIFDKYKSGTCNILAAKFCDELARREIKAQSMATTAQNPWTTLPIPGREVEYKWNAMTQQLRGAEHTDVICFFIDEKGDGLLRFRCSFEKNSKDEISEYRANRFQNSLNKFLFEIGEQEIPNRIIDGSEIGKVRLLGRHKALIKKGEMILGIDFLRGNLYFKPMPGAESLRGLPLNVQGRVSINIDDLAKPEAIGIYFIDGVRTALSHRAALHTIVEKAQREVVLPGGTEQNLISLAENAPALFAGFFIQPLPMIKAHFPDLLEIDNKLNELQKRMESNAHSLLVDEYDSDVLYAIYLNAEDAPRKIMDFKAKLQSL